ncbi:MAG: hypothetical protein IJ943_02485 [Akkermansia sp.]|nr:hypothetical protein [Akkermansia sp.]
MKRLLKYLAITFSTLLFLALISWYGFCYWAKNSWQTIEPPPFHESWSEQQRADLLAIDTALRGPDFAGLVYFTEVGLSPLTCTLRESKWGMVPALLLGWRELGMPARAALHETIRTGKGDVLLPSGIPVADFALKYRKTELLKELIRRGANPNHEYVAWSTPVEATNGGHTNLIWECFEGLGLDFDHKLSPDTRLELLDFMLEHGGNVTTPPNSRVPELYIHLPTLAKNGDKGRATAWALRHGYPANDKCRQDCVRFLNEHNPELLKELQQEGLLPATP